MVRHVPFPFPDGQFPAGLGAAVQRTVLDGTEPAREVIHAVDGSWLVGDGINDPNLPGSTVATHLAHAIERNSSIAELSDLAPGHLATRQQPGDPWSVTAHEWSHDQ